MSMEESSSSSSSSFYLSRDLLIEILQYLPVKTLLRFKSVSKPWFLLIQNSSDFIDRHTALSSSSSSSNSKLGTFIFQSKQWTRFLDYIQQDSWNIFSISDHEEEEFDDEVVKDDLDLPPSSYFGEEEEEEQKNVVIRMKGSCNGLICLYNNLLKDVFLWNPAIHHHQFRLLPKSSFTFPMLVEPSSDFVALGFDVETKDYKVLRVTFEPFYRVQVYSLSRNSWRTLVDVVLPLHPRDISNGGYLNGSYYCMGSKSIIDNPVAAAAAAAAGDDDYDYDYKKIMVMEVLSFDFAKEIFKTIPLPDEITDSFYRIGGGFSFIDSRHSAIIFLGGEKIAATFHHSLENIYEIWVLNEIGVKESWTNLYRIGPYGGGDYRPIGISNNGEFIFVITSNGLKLWLLNPSTQVMKEIQWDGNQRADVYSCSSFNEVIGACVYRRSLVPVCSSSRRNRSTSKLSLKFDTLSVGNAAVLDRRHKQLIDLCILYLVRRFLSSGTK